MNILDSILFQCRINPALPALCAPGTPLNLVSYGKLERMIHSVAGRAEQLGLKSGATVAIQCDDPLLHSVLILGLTYAGMATMSVRGGLLPEGVAVAATISDRAASFAGPVALHKADTGWLTADPPRQAPPRSRSETPCRLILTSGNTGNARCVALTHGMVLQRLALHNFAFGNALPRHDRIFCDLGISTSLGFMFLIHALQRGGTLFWRGADASVTLQSFGLYGVEVMIGSPAGLSEFLRYYEQSPHFGSSFKLIVSAGSRLAPQLAQSVRARLCSHLVSLYGSTEMGMVATAPVHMLAEQPDAVGYVLPGATVEIVSATGEVLPAGRPGVIRIRTDYMASCYLGGAAGEAFRDGWFYPGDVGTLDDDGLLMMGGRQTSIINLGGDKIDPETLEAALKTFPGVRDVAVFAEVDSMGVEQLQIAVVADASLDEAAFRQHAGRTIPVDLIPGRIHRVGQLPRNAMGKLDRAALAAGSPGSC